MFLWGFANRTVPVPPIISRERARHAREGEEKRGGGGGEQLDVNRWIRLVYVWNIIKQRPHLSRCMEKSRHCQLTIRAMISRAPFRAPLLRGRKKGE